MAKVAYYPGCALEGSGGPYDKSTRALVKALGLEMENLRDYNCCGAMEVKNIHPMLQTYLSARNLAIASEQMGLDAVMAPCNGCYHNLKRAEYDLANDDDSVEVVARISENKRKSLPEQANFSKVISFRILSLFSFIHSIKSTNRNPRDIIMARRLTSVAGYAGNVTGPPSYNRTSRSSRSVCSSFHLSLIVSKVNEHPVTSPRPILSLRSFA